MSFPPIILASQSPRRRRLLENAGIVFTVRPADISEAALPDESPVAHVKRLARSKAECISRAQPEALVLGADTVVVAEGTIYGKPDDADGARRMLRRLSGRWHEVLTGVALIRRCPRFEHSWVSRSQVRFKILCDHDIDRYREMVDTLDKAGAYAIQEHGDMLVAEVKGWTSTVIGLPVEDVAAVLRDLASRFRETDCSSP